VRRTASTREVVSTYHPSRGSTSSASELIPWYSCAMSRASNGSWRAIRLRRTLWPSRPNWPRIIANYLGEACL
jgi:hypothetical protein